MFIDAEHALDATYAKNIGVDMASLYVAQPDNGEQGADQHGNPYRVYFLFNVFIAAGR